MTIKKEEGESAEKSEKERKRVGKGERGRVIELTEL